MAKASIETFLGAKIMRLGAKDVDANGGVAALQAELRRVGTLQSTEKYKSGEFDSSTDLAVRRLQWFAANVPGCLSNTGVFVPRKLLNLTVDGIVGPNVKRFLWMCREREWTVTGRLVKVNLDHFSRINPNSGFTALVGNERNVGLCDTDFAAVLAGMNSAASQFGVFVFVNQLFRVEGASVSGAVVPPAGSSAHKIGRAVDLQLGTSGTISAGANPKLSAAIKAAAAGTPFAKFRDYAKKELRCRYGGDFNTSDPPHFDRQILPGGSLVWKFHFYFNQLQYQQAQTNPAAIPDAQS